MNVITVHHVEDRTETWTDHKGSFKYAMIAALHPALSSGKRLKFKPLLSI